MENDIFESSVRSSGDLAAVFEYDGDGGYFYLFDLTKGKGAQCCGAIYVTPAKADFQESDVSVKWNKSQEIVGLYIHGDIWAAFDQDGRKYGGAYERQRTPAVSDKVIEQFT